MTKRGYAWGRKLLTGPAMQGATLSIVAVVGVLKYMW